MSALKPGKCSSKEPLKDSIGEISSNNSRSPSSWNTEYESNWISMRRGRGKTSGMRAYDLRRGKIDMRLFTPWLILWQSPEPCQD